MSPVNLLEHAWAVAVHYWPSMQAAVRPPFSRSARGTPPRPATNAQARQDEGGNAWNCGQD